MILRALLVLVVCLAACGREQEGFDSFTSLGNQFVTAGLRNDSATLNAITQGPSPAAWMARARAAEPQLLQAAMQNLQPDRGEVRGDTAVIEFTFPYNERTEQMGMSFLRQNGQWRITQVQLSNRL